MEVRELYVTLSLDATDFERHIRAATRQIREAESEFRLAAAGNENFDRTLEGMDANARRLARQMNANADIIEQYRQRIERLNNELDDQMVANQQRTEELEYEREERDRIADAIRIQRDRLRELTLAYGVDNDEVRETQDRLRLLNGEQDRANRRVHEAERRLTQNRQAIYRNGQALQNATIGMQEAEAEMVRLERQARLMENAFYRNGTIIETWGESVASAGQRISRIGGTMTKFVSTTIGAAATAAAKATVSYESAFTGVRKTVEATGDDAEAFFEGLSDSVIEMSKNLATSANDVAEVMAIAGQLGIANEELSAFTETVVRLGMSTDVAGEDAASSMARLANITGMSQENFGKMGATIVDLGNKFATTESEILDMTTRIAAAGSQVGLTESELLGFAAALSSVGLEADAGGTAFSTALKRMEVAVETGSEQISDFAKVAGMAKDEFAELWKADPAAAFQAFIVGLSKMDEEGIGAIATLNDMGFTAIRLSDTLLRAGNANELFTRALETAETAWDDGSALIEESNVRLGTMESRIANVKNSLIATGISLGETLMPTVEKLADGIETAVEKLGALDEGQKRAVINFGLTTMAAGPVLKVFGSIGSAVGGAAEAIGNFSMAIGEARVDLGAAATHGQVLAEALGAGGMFMVRLGGVLALVTALTAAIVKLRQAKAAENEQYMLDMDDLSDYKIDAQVLDTDVEVEGSVKGVSLNTEELKTEFIDLLNDGLPEDEEIRQGMKEKVGQMTSAAVDLIQEDLDDKKEQLKWALEQGLISESTYNEAQTQFETQANTLQADLKTKGDAVSAYVTTLCDNNRKMTDAEIAQLNALLEALGETIAKAEEATGAKAGVYEMAYDQVLKGYGDKETYKMALEGIERDAQTKVAEVEKKIAELNETYATLTEGLNDAEKAEKYAELEAKTEELREEADRAQSEAEYKRAQMARSVLEKTGLTEEDIARWKELQEQLDKYEKSAGIVGGRAVPRVAQDAWQDWLKELAELEEKFRTSDAEGLEDFIKLLAANDYIDAENIETYSDALNALIDVLDALEKTGDGEESVLEETVKSVEEGGEELKGAAVKAADGAKDAIAEQWDYNAMNALGATAIANLVNSTEANKGLLISAWAGMAEEAAQAAQKRLTPNPTTGATSAPTSSQSARNASKYLTGDKTASAYGYTTTSAGKSTYTSDNSVNISVASLTVRDDQDVQTIATEIAALTRTQQRNRGVRYA